MIVAAIILAGLLGAVALVFGWRGARVDEHPICRKCGYDLSGRESRSDHCSECGAELSGKRAVRIGHRRRVRPLLALGGLMFAFSIVAGGWIAWSAATNFDWMPYKPLWLLRLEETSPANVQKAETARQEILRRLRDQSLSARQIRAIIDESKPLHGDPQADWPDWRSEFFEIAWRTGHVTDDEMTQYIHEALDLALQLRARARIEQGERDWVRRVHTPARVSRDSRIEVSITYKNISLGDRVIDSGAGGGRFTISATNSGYGGNFVQFEAELGSQELRCDMELLVALTTTPIVPGPTAKQLPWSPDAPLLLSLRSMVEIVPRGTSTISLVDDPAMLKSIIESIDVSTLLVNEALGQPPVPLMRVKCGQLPIGVAFDVLLSRDGLEFKIGEIVQESDGASALRGAVVHTLLVPDEHAGELNIDIILRPNVELARRRLFSDRIWGSEILIENVPISPMETGIERDGANAAGHTPDQ